MKKVIFVLSIFMFFFKTPVTAKYEKKFYDFSIESISGEKIDFKDYKDRVILVVNTASYCGFTKQYDELQKLWDLYQEKGLIVLGVPSNSFNQ
jgi:glutathione peroxidase